MDDEIIVSAAHFFPKENLKLMCVRHCDNILYDGLDSYFNSEIPTDLEDIQGFITNKMRFVDRYEAMKIAIKNNQIRKLVGSQTKDNLHLQELFSENIY